MVKFSLKENLTLNKVVDVSLIRVSRQYTECSRGLWNECKFASYYCDFWRTDYNNLAKNAGMNILYEIFCIYYLKYFVLQMFIGVKLPV